MSVLSHAQEGARRYRALLALPGARAPVVLSAAGSMPIGMFGLGILLLAHDATGSFARGRARRGRLQPGQRARGGGAGPAHGPPRADARAARRRRRARAGARRRSSSPPTQAAPTWVLALCALCGGATFPRSPPRCARCGARWWRTPEQRETAYAMVSIVFEVAVVTAPALVAAIVAVSSPQVAVLAAAALGAGAPRWRSR